LGRLKQLVACQGNVKIAEPPRIECRASTVTRSCDGAALHNALRISISSFSQRIVKRGAELRELPRICKSVWNGGLCRRRRQ